MKYRIINSKEEWDAYAKTGKHPYVRLPVVAWKPDGALCYGYVRYESIPRKWRSQKEAWAAGYMARVKWELDGNE